MSQTTYTEHPAVGREGMIADNFHRWQMSKLAEGDVAAGKAVTAGTNPADTDHSPGQAEQGGSGTLLGVALYDASKEPHTDDAEYADEDCFPVLRKGRVFVVTEDACTPASTPHYRTVAAGAEELGSWRSDTDTGDAVAVSTGARFLLSSGAGGLNILELDL